jgi:hypothetical protein
VIGNSNPVNRFRNARLKENRKDVICFTKDFDALP